MYCTHCRISVADGEHRCPRCSRRLSGAVVPFTVGSTARVLDPVLLLDPPEQPAASGTAAWQASLFGPQKVVPIGVPHGPMREIEGPSVHGKRVAPRFFQQALSFPAPPLGEARVDGVLYRDAKVATPIHRCLAVAVDGALVAMAVGTFFLVIQLMGAQVGLTRQTLPYLGGAAALVTLFYKILWCLCGVDSVGVTAAHLKTVNFDGHSPTLEQRLVRLFTGLLSFAAGGLGLVWALADEEKLTWHDHISKTFLTVDASRRG